MFTPRDISSIQQDYFAALAATESEVVDISQGSFAYTLARANAAVVARQDIQLFRLAQAAYLSKASGNDLDEWGATFNVARKGASPSRGFVLAISADREKVFIANDTLLTDLKTGVQLSINERSSVEINNYTETPIPVVSTRLGSATRLSSGTELFSPRYPSVSFVVGYTRSVSGEYCGSLENGVDRESDPDYRQRISEALNSYGSSSEKSIKVRLENHPLVTKAYVATKIAGIIEVWVDSINILTQSQLLELQRFIAPYTAGGIIISLGDLRRRYVDVNIYVRPFSYSDLDALTSQLTSTVKYIFDTLNVGEALSPLLIQSSLTSFARDVRVVLPSAEVEPQPYELVSYRAIDITYATQS